MSQPRIRVKPLRTKRANTRALNLAAAREALRISDGNRHRAAEILEVSRITLYRWLVAHPELAAEFPAKLGRPLVAVPKRKRSTTPRRAAVSE